MKKQQASPKRKGGIAAHQVLENKKMQASPKRKGGIIARQVLENKKKW